MGKLFIKKWTLLISLLIWAMLLNAQQISIETGSGCLNDTSLLAVNYNNINSLAAATMVISYDTSLLKYVGHTNADILLPDLMSGVPLVGPNAWKIVISWVDNTLNGVNLTSGKLCDLKFIYKGVNTNLNTDISNTDFVDVNLNPISISFTNGSIGPTILSQPQSVQVCEGSVADFTVSAVSGCSYQWQVKNGSTWNLLANDMVYSGVNSNSLHIINMAYNMNNNIYRCIITKNCSVISATALLNVFPKPEIIINNDSSIFANSSVLLSAAGSSGFNPLTYYWNQGLGSGISHLVTPLQTTTYILTITDGHNCTSTDSVIITINPLPDAAGIISGLAVVCQGQSNIAYSVPQIHNATSYTWTLPSGANGISSTNNINVSFSENALSGNITVKGVNASGEGLPSVYSITVNPKPIANAGNDIVVCNGESVTLSANGGSSYLWNNGVIQNVAFTPVSTDDYIVTVTNQYNCSDTDTVKVIVKSKMLLMNALLEGYYLNNGNMIAVSDGNDYKWGAGITDKVIVEIRSSEIPYSVIQTITSDLFTNSEIKTSVNCHNNGLYYIVIRNRNHIETWSANPVSFSNDTVFYDFTNEANKAYGNNQKQLAPNKFAFLVGDINQDGVVDLSDLVEMDSDIIIGNIGYLVNDLNGDGVVDLSDLVAIDENLINGSIVFTP